MEFKYPAFLLLLPLLFGYGWDYFRAGMHLNRYEIRRSAGRLVASKSVWFPFIKFAGLFFIIVAAASPVRKYSLLPDETRGVDIMIALDVSGSMVNTGDFAPETRLSVSKKIMADFIDKRINDRIGLLVFAGTAYLQSPLTTDRFSLGQILADVGEDTVAEQGTAVGDAIMLASYRLEKSRAKSRILVLVTDGVSNTGKFDPNTSSEIAIQLGIRIYNIGIGRETGEINFDMLADIAEKTGGKFFRAETPGDLAGVFNTIDELEKDILPARPRETEENLYGLWFMIGIIIFAGDILGRSLLYRYYV